MNIIGNVLSGQVTGDTAKQLSERFGKIMQYRESLSINHSATSISRSKQLEAAVPPSKISSLSSGEFVGMVADDPDCKIELKAFHCSIINDHDALKREEYNYKEIPLSENWTMQWCNGITCRLNRMFKILYNWRWKGYGMIPGWCI